ncbi:SigE family RNA polymerase sigma factor [Micromonospora parathelypteridis]|uniref:RNA polymerase sigma-70 factor (Sigma-E family) n=1 Tax=Micromonospora parathelypteridis TaxID=1839617 RepID=A0A840VUY8_9ACTN|nr:SigE family RNA polymerase sigma factor [Micromonospora parathelypteridis]MBB5480437.1 RNA polymerase sigma-70 factor (sigma-E family) [Micromonospora parathelypteridis]GGO23370.1 DNA-directed RNA polymerase sigma-70 factor [Micromonospora parathelypteridis]
MAPARWGAARRREQTARQAEFTAFVETSAPRLRRTAYLMCRDWHLAQDLTQTTFAKMYANWGRIRHTVNLDAYSRRVLMNAVFDQAKRRSAAEIVLAELPEAPPQRLDDTVELHVALLQALATLPLRDQAIVVLRHWEDQSVEAVASTLGVTASVVKTQNARALTKLRALLGQDFVRI